MILDPANSFIIVVRAPEFGHPFDDGAWHLVSETATHTAMRDVMAKIAWSVSGPEISVALMKAEFPARGEPRLRLLLTKGDQDINVPAPSEIVRDTDVDLAGFRLLVEASVNRFNIPRWRSYLENGAFEGISAGILALINRLMPRSLKPRQTPWQWLTSASGACGVGAAMIVASVAGFMLLSTHSPLAASKLVPPKGMDFHDWRAGAFDLIQRDPLTNQLRGVRFFPDGRRVAIDNLRG